MARARHVGPVLVALVAAVGIGAQPDAHVAEASTRGCTAPPVTTPIAGTSSEVDANRPATELYDDFTGPAGDPPDPEKWTVGEGAGLDHGSETYVASNAVLDGAGHLALTADKTDSGYVSGFVDTRGKAAFSFGTLVARIKVPSGQGLWPAFWLMGGDEETHPWPGAGEIDVVEMVSDPTTWYSSLHGPIPDAKNFLQVQMTGESVDLSADFHDYWLIHEQDRIITGVDDIVWADFTPASLPDTATWVYNKPFCVFLNLAVGGEWAGQPDSSTPFPATMLVDWVHWTPGA